MAKKHDIIWYDRLDSTNEEAKRHISDIDNLSVLSALEQTAGRGQRGNTWSSKAGENLLFSIVLKYSNDGTDAQLPSLDAKRQSAVSELTALALTEFLSRHQIKAQIKWPNDIYTDDRKICGVLIENSLRGKSLSHSIIGIGLNVNQRNFDVNLPNPGSMALSADITLLPRRFSTFSLASLATSAPSLAIKAVSTRPSGLRSLLN